MNDRTKLGSTVPRSTRLAEQELAADEARDWHHTKAAQAEARKHTARKARAEAPATGGRARALALFGITPVTAEAVAKVDRDRRGRARPVRSTKDRSLPGKARKAARRAGGSQRARRAGAQ